MQYLRTTLDVIESLLVRVIGIGFFGGGAYMLASVMMTSQRVLIGFWFFATVAFTVALGLIALWGFVLAVRDALTGRFISG